MNEDSNDGVSFDDYNDVDDDDDDNVDDVAENNDKMKIVI